MELSPGSYIQHFALFALVLARIGPLVAVAPVFGSAALGLRLRAGLAVTLAVLIVPLEAAKATVLPTSLVGFLVQAGAEALVGLLLGLGVLVLFSALQVTGQLISQMSGLQLAEVFEPAAGENVPVISQLLFFVALAVFLSIGGHRQVVDALLDTFRWLPAGEGAYSPSIAAAATSVLAQSFVLGIRAAAPVMVALLLATLVVGLAGRTIPQLNVLALGFGFNVLVALAALGVSLGAIAWMFQDQLQPVLETVVDTLKLQRSAG